ncbi:hypothetical protein C8N47_111105 [Mangrovibacterium marinum]|uniref:DUF3164 family protein n=1 Tax=Mangrovibacterium marinum TaxID=1639118 RepID=A0A2T5C0F4_9BACT|nr:hypothetical protein [Mangrovibacterium marinum]PTN08065.1 hypothetical protein C8N47_111105 [Mangrovibacterium marinum]
METQATQAASAINISELTPEQRRQLMADLEAEEQAKKAAEQKLKEDYAALKNDQVNETFGRLRMLEIGIKAEKTDIYEQFQTLMAMKMEIFGLTDADIEMQQSHTFTNDAGTHSIILGSNVIDGWTDEVGIGIDAVNKWIDAKITDPKAHGLLKAMLKPNKDGVLQANRVLDMAKEARKIGDKELIEWVVFIQDQWRPVKTSTYVKAKWRDTNNKWQWLALSMSAV